MLNFALHNVDITSIEKVLKTLDSTKASEIDQISVLKDGAPVIAIHLANIINQTQNYKEMTHHSTDTCLSQLTNMILNCADNGKHTGMILIDL